MAKCFKIFNIVQYSIFKGVQTSVQWFSMGKQKCDIARHGDTVKVGEFRVSYY